MSKFGNHLAKLAFSQHDHVLGSGIYAYLQLEKKKRLIINSKELDTSLHFNAYVLTTITEAQNHIRNEMLF